MIIVGYYRPGLDMLLPPLWWQIINNEKVAGERMWGRRDIGGRLILLLLLSSYDWVWPIYIFPHLYFNDFLLSFSIVVMIGLRALLSVSICYIHLGGTKWNTGFLGCIDNFWPDFHTIFDEWFEHCLDWWPFCDWKDIWRSLRLTLLSDDVFLFPSPVEEKRNLKRLSSNFLKSSSNLKAWWLNVKELGF